MREQEKYINALNGLKNADIKIDDEIRHPSIKALEKQIPKKPIWQKSDFINRLHCPKCDGIVGVKQPYCDNCGQKLDWGNEDAE